MDMVNNGGKVWSRILHTRYTFDDLGSSEGITDEIGPLLYPPGPAPEKQILNWKSRESGPDWCSTRCISAGLLLQREMKDNDRARPFPR
jgi:hypothetical protein